MWSTTPGSDVSGGYILITNEGSADVGMGGGRLMDESNHVYIFPAGFIIKTGAEC